MSDATLPRASEPVHGGDGPLAAVVTAQQQRIHELTTALRYRAVIEQAKGVLVARSVATPDEAFRWLVDRSQRTNRKLTRVAAAVVAAAIEEAAGREPDEALPTDPLAERLDDAVTERVLTVAALDSAGDLTTLTQRLVEDGSRTHGFDACVLYRRELDGALQMVAAHGLPAHELSGWRRVPPGVPAAAPEAARTGNPVLLRDAEDARRRYIAAPELRDGWGASADLPVRLEGRTVGVLHLAWREPRTEEDWPVDDLVHLADRCARPLADLTVIDEVAAELPSAAPEGIADAPWFREVLDLVAQPIWLVSAVGDPDAGNADPTTHRVVFANRAAVVVALEDADPSTLRSTRLGSHVLVTWAPAEDRRTP